MRLVLDSSVLIDHLRGTVPGAGDVFRDALERSDELWSTCVVRAEVRAGMRRNEELDTDRLFQQIRWAPVDEVQADLAGELGRRFGPAYPGIDTPDLLVAALALTISGRVVTKNVKHFPMFPELRAPY
ncbi:MAG: type II toxin-antitoxin system VapC family toxin [Candidatus Limnocylindria bacterium]